MLGLLIFALGFGLCGGGVFWLVAGKCQHRSYDWCQAICNVVAGGVLLVPVLIAQCCFVFSHRTACVAIVRGEAELLILEQREDEIAAVVRESLDKYPAFEKEIIEGVDPEIAILRFPELKTNTILLERCKELVGLRDRIYETKLEINTKKYLLIDYEVSPLRFFPLIRPSAARLVPEA